MDRTDTAPAPAVEVDYWLDKSRSPAESQGIRRRWQELLAKAPVLETIPSSRTAGNCPGSEPWRSFATPRPTGSVHVGAGFLSDGQADFPVGGVSWFEADAYATFKGKSLPTVLHWRKAADVGPSPTSIASATSELAPPVLAVSGASTRGALTTSPRQREGIGAEPC